MAAVKEGVLYDNDVALALAWVNKKGAAGNEKTASVAATALSTAAGTAKAYTTAEALVTKTVKDAYLLSAGAETTTGSYAELLKAYNALKATYTTDQKAYEALLVTNKPAIDVYNQ